MNTFSIIFLIALTISFGIEFWLAKRQARYVLHHRVSVPKDFQSNISLAAHQKAADYTLAKIKLGHIDAALGLVVLLIVTFGGGIHAAFELWSGFALSPLFTGVGAIATVLLLMSLVELPSSLYHTFVIEEQFGFNKSNYQQFFKDYALQLILGALLGLPLLALILWLMQSIGALWWLYAWALVMLFSLLMSWLYPTLISPLFNKFTPMNDGALKNKIQALLTRCGFNSQGIFIMDGSKRSGHGNAYFTGLGNNKRIVFFDTLVDSLDDEELEAVLAHELGHFKCKHVIKMLLATAVMTLISFSVLGWVMDKAWFFEGLGVHTSSPAAALLLFMLISPVFTLFMQPISAYFQRRFEFEADSFAAQHAQAAKLISGLVKLYKENANTLTPDPLYSAFHYSHPPAAIRIAHLQSIAAR